ncbi:hypothetical protein [Sorangium sp. So ce861]|uniref:hypothetical protein n=1 Tax=Sorangium sp. So ce861 TaxID=3133323 RepID=UPI003F608943
MAHLEYEVPSLFRFEQRRESPVLRDDETGIRIHAASIAYDGARLRFDLLITCSFACSYFAAFHKLTRGLVFSLEDADGGRASVARTIDPHKRYPHRSGPNFKGSYVPEASPSSFSTRWVSIPLDVPVVRRPAYPTFFVTVFLQEHVSNTLAFNLWNGAVTSYVAGAPSPLALAGDEGDDEGDEGDGGDEGEPTSSPKGPVPPVPRGAGVTLRAAAPRFGPDEPVWFDGSLGVTAEEFALGGADGWLRSLFVCATRQDTQTSRIVHWLGDRLVFPGDMVRYGGPGSVLYGASFRFELASIVGARPPPGVYFVQLSARHYRSPVVCIQCD